MAPIKGFKHSTATRNKMSLSHTGSTKSLEIRAKISKSNLGKIFSQEHRRKLGIAISKRVIKDSTREKHSLNARGRKTSEETKEKIRVKALARGKGRKFSLESRIRMSEAHKGEKSYLWKGGITPINENIRKSLEYRIWRSSVFLRDNYTCIWCMVKGGWSKELKSDIKLNADHIKPFALFPELRFAIDNGRTLCESCHRKTDTYGWPNRQNNLN